MFAHHPRNIFIHKNRRGSLSFLAGILVVGGLFFYSHLAKAVPSYARQTGQNCAACHAGGQFPELNQFGRLFKLTGYTIGEQTNPFAIMMVADYTKTRTNNDSSGATISPKDAKVLADFGSVFVAGKVTNNVGIFSQFTYTNYDHQDVNNNKWVGRLGSDNFDLRYADQAKEGSVIWGVTLHNNPTVQDVWNSSPAWGYPYAKSPLGVGSGVPFTTLIEGGLTSNVAGVGAYAYFNQHIYAELTGYQTAKNIFSVLSMGSHMNNSNGSVLANISGIAPYARLAYSNDWDSSSMMVGVFGLDMKLRPLDGTATTTDFGAASTHYRDIGIDGQYQYLAEPHTWTAHFRYAHERVSDNYTALGFSGPVTLNSLKMKASYVYQQTYGASLAYTRVTGTSDSGYGNGSVAVTSSMNGSPNSIMWTPEVFWMPTQNIRVGLQYNYFTRYLGASSNYDGSGRSAKDNNTTYAYAWFAF